MALVRGRCRELTVRLIISKMERWITRNVLNWNVNWCRLSEQHGSDGTRSPIPEQINRVDTGDPREALLASGVMVDKPAPDKLMWRNGKTYAVCATQTETLWPTNVQNDSTSPVHSPAVASNFASQCGHQVMDGLPTAQDGLMDEPYDVEYEEVVLRRYSARERLGLTLCYGKGDDVDTDIFVSEIEESSIAFVDGRIRVGDQILQVNGVDVHTRNEAMEQFGGDRKEISLLLARSVANQMMTMDDIVQEETPDDDDDDDGHLTDGTKASTHEKDSGISRATDSDPELPPPIGSPCRWTRKPTSLLMADPIASDQSSGTTPTQADQADSDTPQAEDTSFEYELRHLNQEMENIRLACDRLIQQHVRSEMREQPTMGRQRKTDGSARKHAREETSSAYNTGNESCRSTPLKTMGATGYHPPVWTPVATVSTAVQSSPERAANTGQPWFQPGRVMYTNPENLEKTILLQQRLLRQAMIQQAQQLRVSCTYNDRLQWLRQQQTPQCSQEHCEVVKMEWKIKRRSDGSRYLTRRPIRNKILKERAQKLSRERCGLSTDDDAWSELKTGRYWTREERKRHLERAKERKRRQEDLLRLKAESLRNTSQQPILQLSNKKMLKRQGRQLFDRFTTVQEFLSHGSRTNDGAGRALGILSVTTV